MLFIHLNCFNTSIKFHTMFTIFKRKRGGEEFYASYLSFFYLFLLHCQKLNYKSLKSGYQNFIANITQIFPKEKKK